MSYATQSFSQSQTLSFSHFPDLTPATSYAPTSYSQCDSLSNSLLFLSRSLNRMRIAHAIMGSCAIALCEPIQRTPKDSHDIELLMSPESYEQFCQTWVQQRLTRVEGDERQFWDNRTGYLLRVVLTGEWVKTSKRAFQAPDLKQLPKTEDNIPYWAIEVPERLPKPLMDTALVADCPASSWAAA